MRVRAVVLDAAVLGRTESQWLPEKSREPRAVRSSNAMLLLERSEREEGLSGTVVSGVMAPHSLTLCLGGSKR